MYGLKTVAKTWKKGESFKQKTISQQAQALLALNLLVFCKKASFKLNELFYLYKR